MLGVFLLHFVNCEYTIFHYLLCGDGGDVMFRYCNLLCTNLPTHVPRPVARTNTIAAQYSKLLTEDKRYFVFNGDDCLFYSGQKMLSSKSIFNPDANRIQTSSGPGISS